MFAGGSRRLVLALCASLVPVVVVHAAPRPAANRTHHQSSNLPIGISQGLVCDDDAPDVEWTVDVEAGFRYLRSNSIPAFPVLDYCPFGIGGLYCGAYKSCPSGQWGEHGELCAPPGSGIVLDPNRPGADWGTIPEDVDDCPNPSWETTTCPQNEPESQGDCLRVHNLECRIPLTVLPVSQADVPKKYNRVHGLGIDGVTIQGPREAGGLSLLEANIVKDECNGHCTPGMSDARYHYHMSPQCAWSADNEAGEHYTETPGQHSPMLGWEFDGFALYGHQDQGGPGTACTVTCDDAGEDCSDSCAAGSACHCGGGSWTGMDFCRTTGDTGTCENRPVTDECNGHFGPTAANASLVYHYHVRLTPPYTLGCFGPSWQRCEELHGPDANHYCSEICETLVDGVCVQRGFEHEFDIESVEFGHGYQPEQECMPGGGQCSCGVQ
eukprot:COSAG01_NODE_543_length_15700_cov_50.208961_9_plen_439_part_00